MSRRNFSPDSPSADAALEQWRKRQHLTSTSAAVRLVPPQGRLERPRTVSEAAEELGLSVHTIRAWVATRRIAHLRLGRAIRIPAAEIRRIIDMSTVPAVREQ
jgi:excisionase family DNA binding protein